MHLTFRFEGRIKDLRGKEKDWPLIVESDIDEAYSFCNRLGAEGMSEGLDALYAPSAREMGGTCTPIFRREAVSNPRQEALCSLTYRPGSTEIDVEEVPLG